MIRIILPLFVCLSVMAQPKVSQHMMLFEPTGIELNVSETLIIEGTGKGKVQLAIPADAETPVARNGEIKKTGRPGIYELSFESNEPESRVDVMWTAPFILPETLSGRILHTASLVRMVFPSGVKVNAPMLESNGVEPNTQAEIYTLHGTTYKIEIDGAGSLRRQAPAATPPSEEEAPSFEIVLPRLYKQAYWIVGLISGLLIIGFILNYRASVKR